MLFIIIYRLITRHLRTLARDVSDLKPGSSTGPIKLQRKKVRHDELDTLVNSINRFRSERAEAEDALQRDIAKRKLVEAALQESEARLRSSEERLKLAIDAAGLGIWDWDVEQDRLVWDDSMYRLYGVRERGVRRRFRRLVEVRCAGRRRATPGRTSRRRFAATASTFPTSRCGEPMAPSASFAA